jgi:signal transduction histidine kinase
MAPTEGLMDRTFKTQARITPAMRETIHDLRNLFGIVASARHLLGDDSCIARRDDLLDAIEGAATRGGLLTTQLLGSVGSAETVFDIVHHLRALKPMLRAIAGSRIKVRFDLMSHPSPVKIDPEALEAAVLELVTNARAACDTSGTIVIRTRPIRERLWLCVADDGCGMDKAKLAHCLADKAPGAHGTGVGRVRQFARAAHGSFHVRSRKGHGTVVCLNLPTVAPAAVDEPAVPHERLLPPSKETDHEDRQPIAA